MHRTLPVCQHIEYFPQEGGGQPESLLAWVQVPRIFLELEAYVDRSANSYFKHWREAGYGEKFENFRVGRTVWAYTT